MPLKPISFPHHEIPDILAQLNQYGEVFTTRAMNEMGKYHEGDVVSFRGRTLEVESVQHYCRVEDHPFYSQLTYGQKRLLAPHCFDVVQLVAST